MTRNLTNSWQTTWQTCEPYQSIANSMTLKISYVTDWCAARSMKNSKKICWKQKICTSLRHSKCLRLLKLHQNHAKSYTIMQHSQRLSTTRVGSGTNSSTIRQRLTNQISSAADVVAVIHGHCVYVNKRSATNVTRLVTYHLCVAFLAHNFCMGMAFVEVNSSAHQVMDLPLATNLDHHQWRPTS